MKKENLKQIFDTNLKYIFLNSIFILLFLATCIANNSPVYAAPCIPNCGSCEGDIRTCSTSACACESQEQKKITNDHITTEFIEHETWLVEVVWQNYVLPSMLLMAHQLSVVALQQMEIIGTFFDAKHQLESQRLLQQLQAQAHKDYHPSIGMCRFGTNMRSLSAADANISFNHTALAARNTQRILMTAGAIGTGSARDDSRSRLAQFRTTYCNPNDFGHALDILLCQSSTVARYNKDVNYTNNVQDQDTLFLDFSNTSASEDEEDVLALSANLYGNRLLPQIPELHIANTAGERSGEGQGVEIYMDTRALATKRSVAFNSFAAQAAIRSEGASAVEPYMTQILEGMGMPASSISKMLKGRPSYYAQMEILTKKLYQSPNFYSDLYDKPVNVDRKDVAMQAIALMQKRDMYRSQLRSEANMAVWLETLLEDLQEYHTNEVPTLKDKDNKILTNLGLPN